MNRGARMLMDELKITDNEARELLLKHGSVKKAMENRLLNYNRIYE
jgi:hypothetical protein